MASLNVSSFSNNTVADATAVTTNFQNIKTFVESQTVQIDGSVKATSASIATGAITNSLIDYTTVPQIFVVAAYNAALGKVGDIQIVI